MEAMIASARQPNQSTHVKYAHKKRASGEIKKTTIKSINTMCCQKNCALLKETKFTILEV